MSINVTPTAINAALSKLQLTDVPLEDRECIFTISIARLLAYQLPLPADIADPYAEFNARFYMDVEKTAGDINEAVLINISDVVEFARRIWVFRYRVAYDPSHSSVSDLIDALIKCGSGEITKRESSDFIRYSDHVTNADAIFRPLVLSLSGR